ncbi:MAG: efflux RND transporter periplasmic adaptor subunit [Prevotellaceae bacterium]|nr:efflux RND transporter periplasmic adaptor subunit [Prevotellaceae bacterium]
MKKVFYSAMTLICICAMYGCNEKKAASEIAAVKVKVQEMGYSMVSGKQSFSGTIEEANGTELSFSTGGTVKSMYVTAGQMVKTGQLLAEVDPTTLKNAYDATLAARKQAEDAYERMKQLHDNKSLPDIQWIDVQSKLKQAQAAEQIARKSLSDSKLYAPYSGYISEKIAETGQNVLPGVPVLRLVKIDKVKVKIAVPENEISSIKQGATVKVLVSALGDKLYDGVVTEKGVSANPLSRSYEVRATIDNKQGELLPGMVCSVVTDTDDASQAMILPSNIVQIDSDNKQFVWVYNNGKATKRYIKTADMTSTGVVVTDGLHAGDKVITEGQQKISEGMKIAF